MNYVEYRNGQQEAVAAAIDAAEEVQLTVADGVPQKPRLLVENCNPDVTVAGFEMFLPRAASFLNAVDRCVLCSIKI